MSGFHSYAIFEKPPGCPAFNLSQTRIFFKLRRDKFHYMAISDGKQRIMPTPEDLLPGRGKQLVVPESVLLVNPINPDLKGEVDDKYQYSMNNEESGVTGWISSGPFIGFWIIFPSHEFRSGGPTKQNLTLHTGPACLAMFHGMDYIGDEMVAQFEAGEAWTKVVGPIFVYLNSTPTISNAHNLWIDAKRQRLIEEAAWPYDFVSSPHYITASGRGSASGKLLVQDKFLHCSLIPANCAHVGLSMASTAGGWQTESKSYQFWAKTDSNGNFSIKHVIPGVYRLHGWVPGFIGDYLDKGVVDITSGSDIQLGDLVYIPPRDGPTVWEIGFPDRTASGYYVPEVNPKYANRVFLNSQDKFRQYGLWDRYTDENPESEQTFTVGISDPRKDWFFAHVNRKWGEKQYVPSTWTIKFNLESVITGTYKLRLAIASATCSNLEICMNGMDVDHRVLQTVNLGTDNAITRHGIHGLYRLFSIDVESSVLIKGDNSVFLRQTTSVGGVVICGVMYDYIRLEAPTFSQSSDDNNFEFKAQST
ncbi:Rhamnogalacturonate lyase [Linum perenne]